MDRDETDGYRVEREFLGRLSAEEWLDLARIFPADEFEYCFAQSVGAQHWKSNLRYFIGIGRSDGYDGFRIGGAEGGKQRNDPAQRAEENHCDASGASHV